MWHLSSVVSKTGEIRPSITNEVAVTNILYIYKGATKQIQRFCWCYNIRPYFFQTPLQGVGPFYERRVWNDICILQHSPWKRIYRGKAAIFLNGQIWEWYAETKRWGIIHSEIIDREHCWETEGGGHWVRAFCQIAMTWKTFGGHSRWYIKNYPLFSDIPHANPPRVKHFYISPTLKKFSCFSRVYFVGLKSNQPECVKIDRKKNMDSIAKKNCVW